MNSRSSILLLFGLFAILLLGVAILSNSILLGDVGDYLSVGKALADILPAKVRSTHSWFYGLLLSPFLSTFPSLTTAKVVNVFWLFCDALLLYWMTKKKEVLLLWIFSPVVWYMSIFISPLLPASFLLLLSYYLLQRYESTKRLFYFIVSAALLGINTFVWDGVLFVVPLYLFFFFYTKSFKHFFWYALIVVAFASFRFIFDWYLFQFPLFTLFRVFGGTFLTLTHQGKYAGLAYTLTDYLLYFLIISPVLFLLWRVSFKQYGKELGFFLSVFFLFFLNGQARYTLIVAPFALLLLSTVLKRISLYLHILLSLVLIVFLLTPYFTLSIYDSYEQDLKHIAQDYPGERFLVGGPTNSDLYAELGQLYWGNQIGEFVSYQDYDLWLRNETNFQSFTYSSHSRYNNQREVWISFGLATPDHQDYSNLHYLIDSSPTTMLPGFKPLTHYKNLTVFKH